MSFTVWGPIEFADKIMDPEIAKLFKRDPALKNEFALPDEGKLQIDKFLKVDDKILSQVTDERGAQQLLRLIKRIPKIKFKLTPEQELMISSA